jgi:hypothetical protein
LDLRCCRRIITTFAAAISPWWFRLIVLAFLGEVVVDVKSWDEKREEDWDKPGKDRATLFLFFFVSFFVAG